MTWQTGIMLLLIAWGAVIAFYFVAWANSFRRMDRKRAPRVTPAAWYDEADRVCGWTAEPASFSSLDRRRQAHQ